MISYLAYINKGVSDPATGWGQALILAAMRLLQDLPSHSITSRKVRRAKCFMAAHLIFLQDLMVVLRHLMSTEHRRALVAHLDKLFDEHVLLGTGIGSQEVLRYVLSSFQLTLHITTYVLLFRPTAYATVADLVHHLRNDLTPGQVARVAHMYTKLMHNPYLQSSLHSLFAKMMFNLIEVIVAKDTQQNATKVLNTMLESCIDRLDAMVALQADLAGKLDRAKQDPTEVKSSLADVAFIERARPAVAAVHVMDKPEETAQG